jgi:hypothetical protein
MRARRTAASPATARQAVMVQNERSSNVTGLFIARISSFSAQLHEQTERTIAAPAKDLKIAIQRENLSCVQFVSQLDQAGIRKVNGNVAILPHDASDGLRGSGKLEWNLKDPALDVFENALGGSGEFTQQIAALCDHCFATDQRSLQVLDHFYTTIVVNLATIQESYDRPRVEEYWPHRPKPCRRVLSEPRSGT